MAEDVSPHLPTRDPVEIEPTSQQHGRRPSYEPDDRERSRPCDIPGQSGSPDYTAEQLLSFFSMLRRKRREEKERRVEPHVQGFNPDEGELRIEAIRNLVFKNQHRLRRYPRRISNLSVCVVSDCDHRQKDGQSAANLDRNTKTNHPPENCQEPPPSAAKQPKNGETRAGEKSTTAAGEQDESQIQAPARHGAGSPAATACEETLGEGQTVVSSKISKDSGYGSLETKSMSTDELDAIQEAEEIDETQTVYSDASSLLQHPDMNNYISAFANELSCSLPPDFDANDLESISSTLPLLLKAFGIRLGHESTEPKQRQLMYLVCRFRNEIFKCLERMLHQGHGGNETVLGTDGTEGSSSQNSPGMCIDDKMRMWRSKEGILENDYARIFDAGETGSDGADDSNDLDGLDDLCNFDETDAPNLSAYREVLAKSPAYQWLQSSILVKSTLQVPGPGAAAASVIGDQIIRAIGRPAKFSRKKTQELCMQFIIEWDPFLFSQEQEYDQPLGYVLAHAITLTGHGNNVQAATCESYVRQTWPETGTRLLAFLHRTAENESGTFQEVLPDGTRLVAKFLDSELHLEVTGNIFSVTEVAEQVAWIAAALRSSPYSEEAVSSSAHVAELSIDNAASVQGRTRGLCKIEFLVERLRNTDLASNGKCWRGMFRNPVIVRGYPIPRRCKADTGLEVPLEMVAALTNCRRIVRFAGRTFIKGFAAMLAAVRVVGGVVFWHLCYNRMGEYVSYEDDRVPPQPQFQGCAQGIAMDTLARGRHIVGWSDNVKNFAEAPDADYNIEWSGLDETNSMCVLDRVTITGSAAPFVAAGASIAIGVKDKPLHLCFGSGDDYMGNLSTMGKRHFILYDTEERRAWLVDGVSVVLHLLRAYLKFCLEDSCISGYFTYSDGEIEEAGPNVAYTGARAAFEVLTKVKNQKLPLYPKTPGESEERVTRLGDRHDDDVTTLKVTSTSFTLKERVDQLCHALFQITAYHDDVSTKDGFGWRIKKSPRHRIEGFEFMEVATQHGTLWPKVAKLEAMSVGWVDFARALHAVPLFGAGFGELLRPVRTNADVPCYASTASVPARKDFLAVYGADLNVILRWESLAAHGVDGGLADPQARRRPKGLLGGFGLGQHKDKAEEAPSPADRVQVLLPATFQGLFSRGLRSPARVVSRGAVVFGHSFKFPLRWNLTKDVPPEEGEPDPPSVDELSGQMDDSGIGTHGSASSGDEPTPPSLYGLGKNPRLGYSSDVTDSSSGRGSSIADEPRVPLQGDSKKRSAYLSEADGQRPLRKLRRVDDKI